MDILQTINALVELERCGIPYEAAAGDEVKVRCPFHDDSHASCSINITKRVFRCHAAGCPAKSGDLITFLARLLKTTRAVMQADLERRYAVEQTKAIPTDVIERYHKAIWAVTPMLRELHERGITDRVIRQRRIGFNAGRVTIPVYNDAGDCVNVRRYLPGAPGAEKMRNTKGHGKARLYPVDQLKYDTVVVCGGEMKALVVASHLNARGVGAITATAGEGNWDPAFSHALKGKDVYVCMDVDDAGVTASGVVAAAVYAMAKSVRVISLPLNRDAYPTGDVNDYFGRENGTTAGFVRLMKSAPTWEPPQRGRELTRELASDRPLALSEAVTAKYVGKRIAVKAVVTSMDSAPYAVPRVVSVSCDRSQPLCSVCPVYLQETNGDQLVRMELPPESPAVLDMVNAPKKAQLEALREGLDIPPCKAVEFRPSEYYCVEELRLMSQLEIARRTAERVVLPALYVGSGLELNENYELTGRMYPSPVTQQAVLLASERRSVDDALSTYAPTAAELEELRVFQPSEWTEGSLGWKLDELYADLSANVTRIFRRPELHLVVDLAYHSVLLVPFDGRLVKGWVEVLVAGDSSQGKSEATTRMMEHYGLGEKVECKNATVAGLLGGLQQTGSRWFISWGVIPTHDRRLVILEELKGASVEVLARLTEMRSSGIAEIPKIERRRTHARTRLICVSNPRSDRQLAAFSFGVEAIKELIGGLEDVRRFDVAVLLSNRQVQAADLNVLMRSRARVKHAHTAELCRRCVLWAWTRSPEQVVLDDETTSLVLNTATDLCSEYNEAVPLIDRGSMRHKLARLAAALACRTFSTDDMHSVIVRPCHVQYVAAFLRKTYSDETFGYKEFSDAMNIIDVLVDPDGVRRRVSQTPFPKDFVEQMLRAESVALRDICDWCSWDKDTALQLLSYLVRKHALVRDGREYRKTTKFIALLKALNESGELRASSKPDHVEEF